MKRIETASDRLEYPAPSRHRKWRRARHITIASTLSILLLLLFSGVASAHALLTRSDPAAGAILDYDKAPTQVRLWFTEGVNPALTRAVVVDQNNHEVDRGDSHLSSSNPLEVDVGLHQLSTGTYVVLWRAISSDDGHPSAGSFVFRVRFPDGSIPALPTTLPTGPAGFTSATGTQCLTGSSPLLCLPEVLSEWVVFLMSAIWVGGLFWQAYMIERAARRSHAFVSLAIGTARRFRQIALLALPLFVLANIGYVLGQAMLAGGDVSSGFSPDIWGGILLHSSFGIFWMLSELLALLALLVLVIFPERVVAEEAWHPRSVLNWILVGVTVLLLLAMALSSHAAAAASKGGPGTFDVLVDWLHLLATGIWVGGLLFIVLTLLPVLWKQEAVERGQALVELLPRFSLIAIVCVVVAALSGSFNADVQLSSWDQFINTTYGRTLIVKISLFLVMVMISAYHAFRIRPRLSTALNAWDRLQGTAVSALAGIVSDEPVGEANGSLEEKAAAKPATARKKQAASMQQATKLALSAESQAASLAPADGLLMQDQDAVSLDAPETRAIEADGEPFGNDSAAKIAGDADKKTSPGARNGHQRKDGKDAAESGRVLARIERLGDQLRLWIRREATLGAGVLLCAALLGGLAGSLAPAPPGEPNTNAPLLTATTKTPVNVTMATTDGVLKVTLKVAPDKFGTNSVGVLVVDAKTGKPIDGANVHLIINMVEMDMSTSTSDLQGVGSGFYTGQADLLMGGHWNIEVQIRTPQNPDVISKVTFTIPVTY